MMPEHMGTPSHPCPRLQALLATFTHLLPQDGPGKCVQPHGLSRRATRSHICATWRTPAGSCPEVLMSVLSSHSRNGQVLLRQLCPLCKQGGVPQAVSTVCGERDKQVCLLLPGTILRLRRCLQVSGDTTPPPRSSSL